MNILRSKGFGLPDRTISWAIPSFVAFQHDLGYFKYKELFIFCYCCICTQEKVKLSIYPALFPTFFGKKQDICTGYSCNSI